MWLDERRGRGEREKGRKSRWKTGEGEGGDEGEGGEKGGGGKGG